MNTEHHISMAVKPCRHTATHLLGRSSAVAYGSGLAAVHARYGRLLDMMRSFQSMYHVCAAAPQYDPKEAQIGMMRREIELLRQENTYLREQLRVGANASHAVGLNGTAPATPTPGEVLDQLMFVC